MAEPSLILVTYTTVIIRAISSNQKLCDIRCVVGGLIMNGAGYSGHVQISDNADRLGEYRSQDTATR